MSRVRIGSLNVSKGLVAFRAARCVGCESRAAEGRRKDSNQGTERRGERFRNRNRRVAAAARERTGCGAERARRRSRMRTLASRGAARCRRSRPGPARQRERRSRWRENRDAGAMHDGGGQAGGGERSEPPGKGTAQRAKRAEARGIPARRAETACGLGRVARSRSDAPGIPKGIGDSEANVGAIGGRCWKSSDCRTRRNNKVDCGCRGAAAQLPRSGPPEAARSGEVVAHRVGASKKSGRTAHWRCGPERGCAARPRRAGPEYRARWPCPGGCL